MARDDHKWHDRRKTIHVVVVVNSPPEDGSDDWRRFFSGTHIEVNTNFGVEGQFWYWIDPDFNPRKMGYQPLRSTHRGPQDGSLKIFTKFSQNAVFCLLYSARFWINKYCDVIQGVPFFNVYPNSLTTLVERGEEVGWTLGQSLTCGTCGIACKKSPTTGTTFFPD